VSTIELPDPLAARLAAAAAERGMTADELALEVLTERFGPRRLSFTAVGHSGSARGGAEADELLAEGGFGIDSADR
jgi:hypothetical protein